MLRKNLNNQVYSGRFALIQHIQSEFQKAKDDAYLLSMPLVASAVQGDKKLYQRILPTMLKALKSFPQEKKSFKAWMLGRVLLAADLMNDKTAVEKICEELKALLKDKDMSKDRLSAWAIAYLAGLNNAEYTNEKENMIDASHALTKEFIEGKNTSTTDAMWAWVMSLQAAANANDRETYDLCLQQMLELTHENSIVAAISKGLKKDDYPAWALSIVSLAATNMKEEALFQSLQQPLSDAIQSSKDAGHSQDMMLAKVNMEVAKLRASKSILLTAFETPALRLN
ncbi:MAG: hypothetical protein ABI597_10275 [Gammaproteobacteria bacterium]